MAKSAALAPRSRPARRAVRSSSRRRSVPSVDLVQVDVVVVDKDGDPVRGTDAGGLRAVRSRQAAERSRPSTKCRTIVRAIAAPAPLPSVSGATSSSNQTAQAEPPRRDGASTTCTSTRSAPIARSEIAREGARAISGRSRRWRCCSRAATTARRSRRIRAVLAAAVDTLKGRQSWRRPHQAIDKQTGDRIDPERFDGDGAGEGAGDRRTPRSRTSSTT